MIGLHSLLVYHVRVGESRLGICKFQLQVQVYTEKTVVSIQACTGETYLSLYLSMKIENETHLARFVCAASLTPPLFLNVHGVRPLKNSVSSPE